MGTAGGAPTVTFANTATTAGNPPGAGTAGASTSTSTAGGAPAAAPPTVAFALNPGTAVGNAILDYINNEAQSKLCLETIKSLYSNPKNKFEKADNSCNTSSDSLENSEKKGKRKHQPKKDWKLFPMEFFHCARRFCAFFIWMWAQALVLVVSHVMVGGVKPWCYFGWIVQTTSKCVRAYFSPIIEWFDHLRSKIKRTANITINCFNSNLFVRCLKTLFRCVIFIPITAPLKLFRMWSQWHLQPDLKRERMRRERESGEQFHHVEFGAPIGEVCSTLRF